MRTLIGYWAQCLVPSKLLVSCQWCFAANSSATASIITLLFWPQDWLGTRALPSDDLWVVRLLLVKKELQVLGAGGRGCLQGYCRLPGVPLDAMWLPEPHLEHLLWPAAGGPKAGSSQVRSCHLPYSSPTCKEQIMRSFVSSFHLSETW